MPEAASGGGRGVRWRRADSFNDTKQNVEAMLRQIMLRILIDMPADPVKYMIELIIDYHRECQNCATAWTQPTPVAVRQVGLLPSEANPPLSASSWPSCCCISHFPHFCSHSSAKKVIICGPPACGKRTVCEGIAKRLGLEHVSVSDLVDGMMMTDTELGAKMREMYDDGLQMPEELVEKLVVERLREKDCLSKVEPCAPSRPTHPWHTCDILSHVHHNICMSSNRALRRRLSKCMRDTHH